MKKIDKDKRASKKSADENYNYDNKEIYKKYGVYNYYYDEENNKEVEEYAHISNDPMLDLMYNK